VARLKSTNGIYGSNRAGRAHDLNTMAVDKLRILNNKDFKLTYYGRYRKYGQLQLGFFGQVVFLQLIPICLPILCPTKCSSKPTKPVLSAF
jgi:hypothetical protein